MAGARGSAGHLVSGPRMPREPRTLDEEIIAAQEAAVRSTLTDEDRIERIAGSSRMGFDALAGVGAAASFFGSARTPPDDPEYALARETARIVGESGMAIITGGGPGSMEAANRGAQGRRRALGRASTSSCRSSRAATPTATSRSSSTTSSRARSCSSATPAASSSSPAASARWTSCGRRSRSSRPTRSVEFPVVLVGTDYWRGLVDWVGERHARRGQHLARRPRPVHAHRRSGGGA